MSRAAGLGLLALLAVWAAPAGAARLALGPGDREEAVRVGQRSITREAFDGEWRVSDGAGASVVVLTPFHRVVIAARHAAFRGETPTPAALDRLLRAHRNRLEFLAFLRGPRPDFARWYTARLVVGDREIEPAFVQNERTATRGEDGRYLARSVYGFPTRDLPGDARVQLVVRGVEGRDVSRFVIDLATMR